MNPTLKLITSKKILRDTLYILVTSQSSCFPVNNETSRYSIGPRERLIIIDNLYEYDRFKELNYVTDEENTACLEWILKCNSFSKNDLHVASDDGTDINFIYGLRIQKDLISRYKMILEGSDDK